MSEVETITSEDVQTVDATEETARRDSVSADTFLRAYIPGQKSGKSTKEIAEELNMSEKSFSVKATHLRKKIRLGMGKFEVDGKTVDGETLAKSVKVPVNDWSLSKDEKTVEAIERTTKDKENILRGTFKVVSLGFELPKLSGSGRVAQPASDLASLAQTLMGADSDEDEDSETEE